MSRNYRTFIQKTRVIFKYRTEETGEEQKIPGISKFPGKKNNRLSIYLILYRKFRSNRSRPLNLENTYGSYLIGRWKQCSFQGLDKKDTRRPREKICLPVDNWPLTTRARELFFYPACCTNVQSVHGVLAAVL